jgi:hypothetical protein
MGFWFLRIVGNQIGFEAEFAIAAVAARAAFFAKMVGARILGTPDANAVGLFFADTADKGHICGH